MNFKKITDLSSLLTKKELNSIHLESFFSLEKSKEHRILTLWPRFAKARKLPLLCCPSYTTFVSYRVLNSGFKYFMEEFLFRDVHVVLVRDRSISFCTVSDYRLTNFQRRLEKKYQKSGQKKWDIERTIGWPKSLTKTTWTSLFIVVHLLPFLEIYSWNIWMLNRLALSMWRWSLP